MAIKLLEGLHLTATNRRHIAQMIDRGMTSGQSARLSYQLQPEPGAPGQWRYRIDQKERDMWGRWQVRTARGLIEYQAPARAPIAA